MIFSAPWDSTVKVITLGLVIFLLVTWAVAVVGIHRLTSGQVEWVQYLILGTFAAIIVGGWAFAPRAYRVSPSEVQVLRPIRTIRIPLEQVQEVRRISKRDIRGAVRTMGSGGFFGFYGVFRNRQFGSFRMYVTDRSRLVLLRGKKTYVLSPDRPDVFVEAVEGFLRSQS